MGLGNANVRARRFQGGVALRLPPHYKASLVFLAGFHFVNPVNSVRGKDESTRHSPPLCANVSANTGEQTFHTLSLHYKRS